MEQDIEKTHNCLTDVGLPSTIADIKHPTKDYMIQLMSEFLNKFFIDLNAIQKPTFEQLTTLSLARENPEIIMLINLHQVMSVICNEIFITDLNFTDITSPGPKKTRRIAKFLANYVLYVSMKMVFIDQRAEEMAATRQKLNSLKEQKNALFEARSKKALEHSKKCEIIEQVERELARIKMRKTERQVKFDEVDKRINELEVKKHEVGQAHGNLVPKAMNIRQNIKELESKAVRSPEKYEQRLAELMTRVQGMNERRDVLHDAINVKKPALEKVQSILSFVNQEHANLVELTKIVKESAKVKKDMEDSNKKLAEMKSIFEKETIDCMSHKQTSNQDSNKTVEQKLSTKLEQELSSIREENFVLLNQKKMLQKAIEDSRKRQTEICLERDKVLAAVEEVEKETKQFITYSRELYNREIQKEQLMQDKLEALYTNKSGKENFKNFPRNTPVGE